MSKLNRFPTYFLAGLLLISASACSGLVDRIKGSADRPVTETKPEKGSSSNIQAIREIQKTLDELSQNPPSSTYKRDHNSYSSILQDLLKLQSEYNSLKQDSPNEIDDAVKIFELLSKGKSQQIEEAQRKLKLDSSDGEDGPNTFETAIRLRNEVVQNVKNSLQGLKPKVIVSRTELKVDEDKGTQTYMVKLNTKPTSDVMVQPKIEDPTVAYIAPMELTFTSNDWNVGQTVTVRGSDDDKVNDPDRTATITHEVSGGYSFIIATPPQVRVTAIDDDGEVNNGTSGDNQEDESSSLEAPDGLAEGSDGPSTPSRSSLLESIWLPFGILLVLQVLGYWILYQSLNDIERRTRIIRNRQLPENRDRLAIELQSSIDKISKELQINRDQIDKISKEFQINRDQVAKELQSIQSDRDQVVEEFQNVRTNGDQDVVVDKVSENELVELFNQSPQGFSRSLRGQGLNPYSVAQTLESNKLRRENFGQGDFILKQSSATDFWVVEIGSNCFLFPSDNYIAERLREAISDSALFETTPSNLSTRRPFMLMEPAKVSAIGSNSWKLVERGKLTQQM